MPFFTSELSPRGPIVSGALWISPARCNALEAAGIPVPPWVPISALLDTGASCRAVDPSCLDALGLTPTGEMEILTPSTGRTPQKAFTYDVRIGIFAGRQGDLHYLSETLQVMSSDLFAGQGIHVLMGRDILAHCFFAFNGADGLFTLAF